MQEYVKLRSRHRIQEGGTSHTMVPARFAHAPAVAPLSVQEMSIVCIISFFTEVAVPRLPARRADPHREIYERSHPWTTLLPRNFPLTLLYSFILSYHQLVI